MSPVSGHSLKTTTIVIRVNEIRRMLTTSQFRNIPVWLLCKNVRTKTRVASGSQYVLVNIVMNLRVKWRVGNFLSVLMTPLRGLLHGTAYWLGRNVLGIQQQQSNFANPQKILVKRDSSFNVPTAVHIVSQTCGKVIKSKTLIHRINWRCIPYAVEEASLGSFTNKSIIQSSFFTNAVSHTILLKPKSPIYKLGL